MRVLLDECLPRGLARLLVGHEVTTVAQAGWTGKTDGELLKLAATGFDAFVTIDQNLEYQQSLRRAPIAVVVVSARSNRLQALVRVVPEILDALAARPERGVVVRVGR